MRDFRDAKAMAHTLRALLADHGVTISNSQSLELIAKAFGVADWNTLAATIRASSRVEAAKPPATIETPIRPQALRFATELERTLQRALGYSDARRQQYTTLEHFLLALIDDADASRVMLACAVDLAVLRQDLTDYIDNELQAIVVETGASSGGTRLTAAFQRVMQRTEAHAEQMGQQEVTGANVMVVIFAERLSPAVRRLHNQDMTAEDAAYMVERGIAKRDGAAAP
ncbi:glyoxalase superfamily protein [Bradyrhizobium sp. LHD-71]|uniref:glyoxalase superfamily protein n=1 Tax=Bradyrhizobium sp. LHD-71 TaxID=3072141 RepID=UPI00280DBAA1|nr:glyoxalase superfamily protein [Bradyrhizobium sp. LHD-71]MDQ8730690.1 glyoxalase superfamily protein [Bradyrhizobium sp. LHD-71]